MIEVSKLYGTTHWEHGWCKTNADFSGVAPTIDAGISMQHTMAVEVENMGYISDVKEVKDVGYIDNGTGKHQSNTVYDADGLSPNITTVNGGGTQQIKIIAIDEQNNTIRKDTFGTLTTDGSSPKHNNRVGEIAKIKIRQATKQGFIECEVPGICDLNYADSTTRRGRVIEGGANKSNIDNGEYP